MDFKLLVIGSGAATPTFARACSSQLLNIYGMRILIDCGESTQDHLRHYHQKIQSIKHVFLSHLHGDHFFGIPGLLSTMHLCGRTTPMTLYGPAGVREALEPLFRVSATNLRYPLEIVELDSDTPTVICREKHFHVTAFPLHHSIPTYGYLFEEETPLLNMRPRVGEKYGLTSDQYAAIKNGSDLTLGDGTVIPNKELTMPPRKARGYAYCCDTAYEESIIDVVRGVDLLCMESTFDSSNADIAEQRCHCTAAQAATIASKAGVGRLLLTHFSARYSTVDTLLDEAKAIFPNTIAAEDGGEYEMNCEL